MTTDIAAEVAAERERFEDRWEGARIVNDDLLAIRASEHIPGAVQVRWTTWNQVCEMAGDQISPENPGYFISAAEVDDTCGEEGPDYIGINLTPEGYDDHVRVRHGNWLTEGSQPGTFHVLTNAEMRAMNGIAAIDQQAETEGINFHINPPDFWEKASPEAQQAMHDLIDAAAKQFGTDQPRPTALREGGQGE